MVKQRCHQQRDGMQCRAWTVDDRVRLNADCVRSVRTLLSTCVYVRIRLIGIANYRDQMHLRFLKNVRRGPILPFLLCAFAVPAFFYVTTSFGDAQIAQRKAEFEAKYKIPESRQTQQ
jgi:hypothetical protein